MRNLSLLIILLITGMANAQQKPDCKNFHDGTFEIGDAETGISVIERKGNFQTETNAKHGYKAQYDVVWIDECTYVVKNRKVLESKNALVSDPKNEVKVEFITVDGNKATARLSSNFADAVFEVQMVKTK